MVCDGPVWQSVVLSFLVPETDYMFCCSIKRIRKLCHGFADCVMPPNIPLLTFIRGDSASCCASTPVLFPGTSWTMGWFSAPCTGCCASSTGLQWEQLLCELQEASNRQTEPHSMTCNLLGHLARLTLQLRALCVGTTCQTACLFLLLLLLLCPGLDLWCCLCLGGILQQWEKSALIENCHYLLGCDVIWSGRQVRRFWRNALPPASGHTNNPPCSRRQYIPPKHLFVFTTPDGLMSQKTVIFTVTVVRTSVALSPLWYLSWLLLASFPPSAGTQHTQRYSAVTQETSQ
jgi:hypothetical protein